MRLCCTLLALLVLAALVPNLRAEDDCPVTTAPNPPFVPPVPYRPNAPDGSFWYGTNALWTSLPVEGAWSFNRRDGEGYSNKLFLWTEGYDGSKEPSPDITVLVKRLDGDIPRIESRGGTNAYFDHSWAMLTGVHFPTEGCWKITVFHHRNELSFVLSIQPAE
jgi:hypothetical protein